MKIKIGTFMIAAILSSSCVYSAKALRLESKFEIQPRVQESELSMQEVDLIIGRLIAPKNSNMALLPQIFIYGPYYYDGPLEVLHLSDLQKAPQSATPYKSISNEELLNWANTTK